MSSDFRKEIACPLPSQPFDMDGRDKARHDGRRAAELQAREER
jgi:hypothetical protein